MSRPPWQEFLKKPEIQKMLDQGAKALETDTLEERVRQKRVEYARSFGLHTHVTSVTVSPDGDVRVCAAFEQDPAFVQEELKGLEINGIRVAGARIVEVHRNAGGRPAVEVVISGNVDRSSVPALRVRPLYVSALTMEDVRVQGAKMV
jgi:hypothetical protein